MKLVIFFNLFLLLSTSLFSQQVLSAKEKGLRELSTSYYEKSIILYTKLISAKPTDYLLYKERAAVYSKLNRHSKVISDCSKALKLNPTLFS